MLRRVQPRDPRPLLHAELLRQRRSRVAGAHARSASSAMTFESWPPCQASGDWPSSSTRSSAPGIALRVLLADRERVAGVGLVAARDHDRRRADPRQRVERSEGLRARDAPQRVGDRLRVLVARQPLAHDLQHRVAELRVEVLGLAVGLDEPVHAVRSAARRSAGPSARGPVGWSGWKAGRDEHEAGDEVGLLERDPQRRVRAHRRAGEHRALDAERVEDVEHVRREALVAVGVGRWRGL